MNVHRRNRKAYSFEMKSTLSTAHSNCISMTPPASPPLPVKLRRKKILSDRLLTTRHSVDVGTLLRLGIDQKDTKSLSKSNKNSELAVETPEETCHILDPTKPCRLNQVINEEITSFNFRDRPKLQKRPSKSWMLICQSYDEEDSCSDTLPRIRVEGEINFELGRRGSYVDICKKYGIGNENDLSELRPPKALLSRSRSDSCLKESISDIDVLTKDVSVSEGSEKSMESLNGISSSRKRVFDSNEEFGQFRNISKSNGKNSTNNLGLRENWLRTSSETCLNNMSSNVQTPSNSFSTIHGKGKETFFERRPTGNKTVSDQTKNLVTSKNSPDDAIKQTKSKKNPLKQSLVARSTPPHPKNKSRPLHLPLIERKSK